ncbi:MAG: sensor histidine kinase, partial [bacterium]
MAQSRGSPLVWSTLDEGTRLLLPALLLATIFYTVTAAPMGIQLPAPVYACDGAAIAVLFVASIVVNVRRIPVRWAERIGTVGWWCPSVAIIVTQAYTHKSMYVLLLIIMTASSGVMANTWHVVFTLVAINVIEIPLIVRDSGENATFSICALLTASAFAQLVHVIMRRSLLRTERHRRAEAETARELARQLTELERSHAERDRLADQLLHAQRMEAVGTLAAGVAHDMNNVLAAITSFAELLRDDLEEPGPRGELAQIIAEAERGASLTRGLLAFSRRGQYRKQVVDIGTVIRDALPLLGRTLPKSIAIHDRLEVADVRVEGDPVHLTQALVNLGLNAADAMSGTGALVLAAAAHDLA